jgi:hypothetical protein
MSRSRTAGVLWLIAGVSTAGIAFFIVDPVTLGAFIIGVVAAVALGLAFWFRPSPDLVTRSNVAGAAWLVAFGTIIVLNITNPVEEVLSLVWILLFGVLGAATAYRWGRTTPA